MELFPHQAKAVDEMHNGCILVGGVGTGKSFTSLHYFYNKVCGGVDVPTGTMRTPMDLYVITTAKKRDSLDWEGEAAYLNIGKDRSASIEGIKITVDSWNNIGKYTEVENAFFIFDEQRLVGSGAWAKSFIKIAKHNQWIVLSATPGDTWMDYIPVFIANGFYKNRTEFKREHVIYNTYSKFPKVDRYVAVGKLVRLRKSILVEMPYVRHTVRHNETIEVAHNEELFRRVAKDRWHVYEDRPLKNVAEQFLVMRKVANSDPSRIEAIRSLMKKHDRLVVFYNFDYELEMLRNLAREFEEDSNSSSGMLSTTRESTPSETESPSRPDHCESPYSLKTGMDLSAWSLSREVSHSKSSTSHFLECTCKRSMTSSPGSSERCERCSTQSSTSSISKFSTVLQPQQRRSAGSTTTTPISSESASVNLEQTGKTSPSSGKKTSKRSRTKQKPRQFEVAEWNGHNHDEVPSSERWLYLVQYVAGAEGWNCTSTDATCFYSLTYSYKNYHQAHGRIDRLNTPYTHLWYYSLVSKAAIDQAVKKALNNKKNFNESDFGRM